MKLTSPPLLLSFALTTVLTSVVHAQAPQVPDWALPGSATHQQVPPPTDFHRATKTVSTPLGVFEAQSDIGAAVVAGSSTFDSATKRYTLNSAGYNIWYTRDEFRYIWKKISGDVSLAADVTFPNADGYGDRKVVLVIRQDLDDNAKEIMTGLHGAGLIHLAERSQKGANIKEDARLEASAARETTQPASSAKPTRIGIEKKGDQVTLYVSVAGEPLHVAGTPATIHFDAPFYVGIGFCSHIPDKVDSAVVSNVVFENSAGKVK